MGELVLSAPIQGFVLAVILVNAVTLGLQTSRDVVEAIGGLLAVLDTIALVIFVVELVLKMFALGRRFWRDGWNVFDVIVVVISLVPVTSTFSVLRSLRVLRVLRLVNRLPQLRRIATAILKSIPGIGAIAGLTAIIFYVGAVMATSMFGRDFPELFGSIATSLLTLFQVMTLDNWTVSVVFPIMEVHPYAWTFFLPFILLSAFVMLNLFVAIIVDTMSNMNASNRGTVADPAPIPATADHSTTAQLAAVRSELAEIKALLAERGGRD